MLEEEVYGDASPIWDPEFSQANVNNTGFSLLNFIEKKNRNINLPEILFILIDL